MTPQVGRYSPLGPLCPLRSSTAVGTLGILLWHLLVLERCAVLTGPGPQGPLRWPPHPTRSPQDSSPAGPPGVCRLSVALWAPCQRGWAWRATLGPLTGPLPLATSLHHSAPTSCSRGGLHVEPRKHGRSALLSDPTQGHGLSPLCPHPRMLIPTPSVLPSHAPESALLPTLRITLPWVLPASAPEI